MPGTQQNQPVAISPVVTQESRPVPDPTALTTQQLNREIASIKEFLETKLTGAQRLSGERFKGVDQRFRSADKALTAALTAQKEAVGKTEASFAKQIEAMDVRVGEQRDRLTAIENRSKGAGDLWGYIAAAVMALVAIGALATTIVMATRQ